MDLNCKYIFLKKRGAAYCNSPLAKGKSKDKIECSVSNYQGCSLFLQEEKDVFLKTEKKSTFEKAVEKIDEFNKNKSN